MKRTLALALTLILAFSLSIPAAAASDDYWNGVYDGETDGYDAGYADAEAGKAPAYPTDDSYDGGYDDGFIQGYISGYEESKWYQELKNSESYQNGYAKGYADGYEEVTTGTYVDYPDEYYEDSGYAMGYDDGYWDGREAAEEEVRGSDSYQQGYADGYEDGYNEISGGIYGPYPDEYYEDSGYALGYDDGYMDGYLAAMEDGGYIEEDWDPVSTFGGTAGKVNVMLNGLCINFDDVWPENHNGRVMAPVRAVLEALGATVEYDLESRTVTAELDGNLLIHQVGTSTVEVYADGDTAAEPRIITMDCTSLLSGGRTLVPVRFFSEALGFDVYWDGEYRTVVLIDPDYLDELSGENLTVFNLLLATASAGQKSDTYCHQTTDVGVDVTVFDTLNGNTELGGSAKLDAISGQEGQEATLKLDLRKLFDALEKKYGGDAYMRELSDLLGQTSMEFRFDAATEQLYIGGDLLGAMTGLPGAWYQEDMSGSGWTYGQTLTAADLALQAAKNDYFTSPIYYMSEAAWNLEQLTTVLGDDQFTKSGNTYTYNSTALDPAVQSALEELCWMLGDYSYDQTASFDLTVTDKGNGTCSYQLDVKFRSESIALEFDASGTGSTSSATVKLHLRNMFEAELTADTTVQTTTTKPETVPKDLEASLELEELPNFYM